MLPNFLSRSNLVKSLFVHAVPRAEDSLWANMLRMLRPISWKKLSVPLVMGPAPETAYITEPSPTPFSIVPGDQFLTCCMAHDLVAASIFRFRPSHTSGTPRKRVGCASTSCSLKQ